MWTTLLLLAACGPPTRPYADDLPLGTACVTVEGVELCADADVLVAERTEGGFRVTGLVDVPDRELGYEQAALEVTSNGNGFAVLAPLAVDCVKAAAHGDHCHPEVSVAMSCSLPLRPRHGELTVDRLTDDRVYARFEAVWPRDRPPCCSNDCTFTVPATSEPSGPMRVTGVVHLRLQ